MNNLEQQAKKWKPPATLEDLATEWDKLEQYYQDLANSQPANYAAGSFQGKAIGISICASQLRAAIHAVAKEAATGPAPLTFQQFSKTNRQRCEDAKGFNHKLDSWSTSDWFLALLGELGEAANIAKKLNRVRDGIPGNKLSKEELQEKLKQELGDSFVYLDLLCQSVGVAIGDASVEVFNAKSRELGCPIEMPARPASRSASGRYS